LTLDTMRRTPFCDTVKWRPARITLQEG
jgi:hypothetical protein